MSFRTFRVFAWIAVWLLLAEVALELRAYSRGWPTVLFGDATPPAESSASEYGPTDRFPFRSRIYPERAEDGTTRIWLGSSSYAEDVRQPPDRLFISLAETTLHAKEYDIEVFNSSRGGLTVIDNLRDLTGSHDRWGFDMAVLYQMTNDMDALTSFVFAGQPDQVPVDLGLQSFLVEEALRADEPSMVTVEIAEQDSRPSINERVMSSVQRAFESTSAYAQAKNQITSRLVPSRVLASRLGDDGNALFFARIHAFIDACLERDIQPVLCTFPTSHTAETAHSMPSDSVGNLFRYNIYLSVLGWIASVAELNEGLRAIAAEREVPIFEMAEAVTGRSDLFRDFTHLNREGHEVVSQILAKGLEAVLER